MRFFQIIRWKNLMMLVVLQALIEFHLLAVFYDNAKLSFVQFLLLLLATLFITAGGYIINDIEDISIDRINKPERVWIPLFMSKTKALQLYYFFTLSGLFLGFLLVALTKNYSAILYFLLPIFLLYLYAKKWKKSLFIGNITVSFLVFYSVLIVVLFNIYSFNNKALWLTIFVLGIFIFLLNIVREIIKDAEDITGDKAHAVQSIPIKYGLTKMHTIVYIIMLLLAFLTIFIAVIGYKEQVALSIYLLTAVVTGIILFISQLSKVQKETDYGNLSTMLKLLMWVGLISILFIKPF